MWPGQGSPARPIASLLRGAVTSASASPASTRRAATRTASTAALPASALGRPANSWSTGQATSGGAWIRLGSGSASRSAASSIRAWSPTTIVSYCAATSGRASALSTTSGPIPAGSPSEIARRGRAAGRAPDELFLAMTLLRARGAEVALDLLGDQVPDALRPGPARLRALEQRSVAVALLVRAGGHDPGRDR